MTLNELDAYFNSFLHKENFPSDPSRNGVQIQNSAPDIKQITKIAFATDACAKTAEKAIELGAQLLFVHHGIFWGDCTPLVDAQYKRVSAFLKGDLALYASHIPLDANEEVGNNYGLARRIGLKNIEKFGEWHGMSIGAAGYLDSPCSIEQLCNKLFPNGEKSNYILPFGKKEIQKVPDGLRKVFRSGRQQPLRCGYSAGQLRGLPGAALSDVGQGVQSRLQKGGQRGLPPLGAVYSVPQHRLRQRPEPDARGRKPAGYRGAHRFFRMGLCDRLSAPAQRLHLCQADAGR